MTLLDRLLGRAPKPETRSIENPQVPISSREVLKLLSLPSSIEGINVTTDLALSVPAVACAVNFLAGTIAGLPLKVYRKTRDGRAEVTTGVGALLHQAVNPQMSSYEWRKYCWDQTFTEGRQYTFIERNGANKVSALWPLDPAAVTVMRQDGRKLYRYRENGRTVTYEADEIIDIPFMLKRDMVSHRSPVLMAERTIAMLVAFDRYGASSFQNGGIPPLQMVAPIESPAAIERASADLAAAVKRATQAGHEVLAMPFGHELKPIGFDPDKMQLEKAQRFGVEQIARVYNLPPAFLQDLTRSTFSNAEHQDLQFVKHTLKRHLEQAEQEMSLKLFGPGSNLYVEFLVDGLLRGDFKTRMEGYSIQVQNGLATPNEIRALENRPPRDQGNELMIQGGTVPLGSQPIPAATAPADDQPATGDPDNAE